MTTHLVIADDDTLDALAVESADNPNMRHINHREAYLNGDRWLFRTPDSRTDFESVEFAYCDRPEGYPGLRLVMPFASWSKSVLPLIAACDLLGVDEL